MKMVMLNETVLNILDSAEVDGNTVRLTCGQLDRTTYQNVNKALEALGGKWNRKQAGHVFADEPRDRLEAAILAQSIVPPQAFGYFPTPDPLGRKVVALAELQPGMSVLEPSAGDGALARLCAEVVGIDRVDCYEIQPELTQKLMEQGFITVFDDFLTIEFEPDGMLYDRVVMNPPFERQQDIDHVLHAWQFLKPGGRLISIMSAGVVFRENRKTVEFRSFVESNGGRFITNPDDAFKPSGTQVRTITLVMDRRAA